MKRMLIKKINIAIAIGLSVSMLFGTSVQTMAEENTGNEEYIEDGTVDDSADDTTSDIPNEDDQEDSGNNSQPEDSEENQETEENPETEENEQQKDIEGEPTEEQQTEEQSIKAGGADAPTGLKINLLSEPYGVNKASLSFSWIDSMENGMEEQSAYRIVIAKRDSETKKGKYVYDSGWKNTAENSSQLYNLSGTLADNELYYWQVQTRNKTGVESSLSEAQAFTTAVGNGWTSTGGSWKGSQKAAFFRTEFSKNSGVEKAVLNITATSTEAAKQYVYNLYINGTEIGVGPARQNGTTLFYDSYDVTDYLNDGKNVLGIIAYSEKSSGFLCQLTYYMADGSKTVVTNSAKNRGNWKGKDGDSILWSSNGESIGTNYYTARRDNINARAFPYGWNTTEYNASDWSSLQASGSLNGCTITPSETETMKRHTVVPSSVTYKNGTYLIDFGREIIGSIELNLNTSAADITLEYGEELDGSGNAKYQLITRNKYQETWKLKSGNQKVSGIGMKTFRYVTIRNLPTGISAANVKGLALYQEFDEEASSFTSSNKVLNDVYNLTKYTSKVNGQMLYVDSQNRERKPYEGDALIAAMNNYSYGHTPASSKYTAEWLLDNTTWPAEYSLYNIMLIYQNYLETGDTRTLAQSYQLLKNKTLEGYYDSSLGLMGKVENTSLGQRIMVDWPSDNRDGYKVTEAYYNTVFNAVCVGGYESMAKIASALGYTSDAAYYQNLANTIRNHMISKLYNASTGEFKDGLKENGQVINHSAQHATAYALVFGIYNSQTMADRMAASIENDQEVRMSIYGSYFLLQGLYKSNHGTLARKIMSNSERILGVQSWGYLLYGMNATTATEAWNSKVKSNMSFNHPWGSAPGVMLMRGMFGINPTSPGYDTFDIKLQPGGVNNASIKVPTIKGNISVSYTLDSAGGMNVTAEVPANTKATLYIPAAQGQTALVVDGMSVKGKSQNGYLKYELTPGTHQITSGTSARIDNSELAKTDVVYKVYTGNKWSQQVTNGIEIGSDNEVKIQAVNMTLRNQNVSGTIQYSTHMQKEGWKGWSNAGSNNGNTSADRRMEAVRIRLTGQLAQKYNIYYRTYVDGDGWLDWASNGDPAGSSGRAKAIYKIQIKLLKKGEEAPGDMGNPYLSDNKELAYQTHVQSYGWQKEVTAGAISGTTGKAKRLEGIKIRVKNADVPGDITYSTHVQSYGWQSWRSNGALAGTTGEAKRLEAIRIKLTGQLAQQYDVYYRVHAQTFGWMGWAKNGEASGTEGYARRLEAIQIVLVRKGNSAPGSRENAFKKAKVTYCTHVQSYGWKGYVYDGELSGTEGKAKRLEGIRIKNKLTGISGSVQYRTHVQTYGWESRWKHDGQISGTVGQKKRLEAIQIRLTGQLAKKYDVYYRVHIQSYGWLDWAKNGESAGSEGLAKRLEAIEIQYVEKGGRPPGHTSVPFMTK